MIYHKVFEKVQNLHIKLECKSCFDFFKEQKSNSVNLILIDPPYEISRDTNFKNGKKKGTDIDRFRVSYDFGDWDHNFTGMNEVIKECYRILKPSGALICFYDLWKISILRDYILKAGFKQLRFVEWLKTNPVPVNSKINYLTNAREIALTGTKKGKPVFHSEYDRGIYQYPICHDKNRFHPTQKPECLIIDLILKHSDEGDIVMDCFSGSGTTAVAALANRRSFIGCEIDENYYKKSIQRIRNKMGIKEYINCSD